jgi:zinc transport system permease protein
MLDDFFFRAMAAGVGVALLAGPLGCFIVWRRMAYFGDTMAHSALLGIALGFLLDLRPTLGVVAVTTLIAVLLVSLQRGPWLAMDTLLGILAHASLSLGLVVLALMVWLRLDLLAYLFGDILAVTAGEVLWIYGGGGVVLAALVAIWRPLLAATVDEDLARAEGIPVARVRLTFMVLIALVIAMAMKLVGILLITSLLIIPAATARRFARTPEQMAVIASAIGAAAVVLGLKGSLRLDTPSGPSIVVAAALLFALSLLPFRRRSDGRNSVAR